MLTNQEPRERELRVERDLPWLPPGSVCRTVLSLILPQRRLITMAAAFAFRGDQILLVDLVDRGWDIPGGHLEGEEDPEAALHREAYEEAGARLGGLRLFAHMHFKLRGARPPAHPYPHPESYIVLYWARVMALEAHTAPAESRGGALFAPVDARAVPWIARHSDLYEAALRLTHATG